jgi:hypothetical protein
VPADNCTSGIKIQIPMPAAPVPPKPVYLPRSIQTVTKKRTRSAHSAGAAKNQKRPKKEDSEHDYADDSDNGEDVFS